jgi:hypothetical protein
MSLADRLRIAMGDMKPKPAWKQRPELLLLPNIPKPMHRVAPREILGSKWWNETRQAAYRSTSYHCLACGVYKMDALFRQWLEGHEVYEIDYVHGRMVYVETVPLCHCCHNYSHDGRLQALLGQGKVSQAKFVAIIQHGDGVLFRAGLRKVISYDGPCAEWKKWWLVLNGKQYPPHFKTFEQWKQAFNA